MPNAEADQRVTPAPAHEYDLVCEEGVSAPLTEGQVTACCDHVLAEEGVTRPCLVSVSFVGEGRIRELNAEWRGVDRATDVISLECERPDDPSLAPGEPCELGDVVLAPTYIARQAAAFGTTEADECRLLLTHGLMHLLGYDHLDEDEAEAMEVREEELLSGMGCDAPIDRVVLTRHREGMDE
ncbi:rRNA maturation RNase YbeY [Olsenella profusa]|uniref:Endoribonuclease YbeY n=1 Tax=Olsenella profusa TaxID=138595 RepID=A0ABS2F2Z7_9ACTN|nr:rRNA maturation RNase YbeY [Olsenella profusa]MBM6775260.1 rRNA maturation RNase YbeY [Olsenella profusa]